MNQFAFGNNGVEFTHDALIKYQAMTCGFNIYYLLRLMILSHISFSLSIIPRYRKTFNSKLRCNGVSSIEAASLLGHSKEVNENYFTFDIRSLKEKADMVSKVIKKS